MNLSLNLSLNNISSLILFQKIAKKYTSKDLYQVTKIQKEKASMNGIIKFLEL